MLQLMKTTSSVVEKGLKLSMVGMLGITQLATAGTACVLLLSTVGAQPLIDQTKTTIIDDNTEVIVLQPYGDPFARPLDVDYVPPALDVLDDTRLTALCILGAIAGAFLAVALWPPQEDTDTNKMRRLAAKFGSSMIAGATFTPMIIRWSKWSCDADVVLATSTGVAMLSVAIIHATVPLIEKAWKRWVIKKLNLEEKQKQEKDEE